MTAFIYDKTFEGLLTVVFDAYFRKTFPDALLAEGEPLPLFCDETLNICTDSEKAGRVWKGLQKKLSATALSFLTVSWLSELSDIDLLLFRYIRKTIDAPQSIELNFGDPDVLEVTKICRKVSKEIERVLQFLRFQKATDGTFFAAIEPMYNVLSLVVNHFQDRFADQKWLIYDLKREYGYYYDLSTVTEVSFEDKESHLLSGILSDDLMAQDEKLFQQLWKEYFKSITIKERINPKLHKQNLPVRFWKYLTEKQK
ncbi:TIGR03915 family putative DNA repair protein [uncultured Bacteroides sp.]|uniref:TIGR03915 family putative DNA repair protein n=1 Tax=uncultured Bacteroides sp. TaxID=162156 RepID=UPI002AAB55DC|nr:TIGR03915 family putative DNA repair protein [uncultured Bacteroides sp.]